ncbi:bifunctional alpha/beta hydrolase/OsmC family protein [Roseovarius aestuarii]|nr:bifunctional alpha/beta hydrolase/OsmC family protein [Roseovarius aestuarii]
MAMTRLTFQGHDGSALSARLDMPDGPHLATALFAHCFTCSKDIPAARRISARLAGAGIAVLRFDFTGLGHSEGEFENTTFTSNIRDLELAAAALSARDMAPSLLIGHSLGGAAVLAAARKLPSVRAVATIGAPFDPEHVTQNFGNALNQINSDGVAEVNLGGRPIRIGKEFIENVRAETLKDDIANLKRALLVLHAPRDEIVGIENASDIFSAAKHPKSFVTLDDADHLITRPRDAEYAAQLIAAWAMRYLEVNPPAPPPGAPEGIVRVSEADPDGYLQDINAGPRHHTLADEPLAYGGTDRGMSPYGFLSAGLGACTSMTIRMYARRKNWPLTNVRVEVSHDKVHAQDASGTGGAKADTFIRTVFLDGDLDSDQRARLLAIADKCPVHRTLESSATIQTTLAD